MTTPATETAPPRGARRLVARLQERGGDEGGFVLLETMIALTLITVIMAAVSVEYVNGVIVSAQQRSAATASQLASSAMADLRSYNATDLVTGRSQADVITQRNRLLGIDRVKPWVSGSETVTAYSTAGQQVVPTAFEPIVVSGREFRVDRYLECVEDATDGACASAGNLTRLIVAVAWNERGCPKTGCAFVSTTLVDTHADPTFDINQPLPSAPVVVSPGDQVVAIGDRIGDKPGDMFPAVRFLVEDGKGAAPFSWKISGPLPAGLSFSPDGAVSGIPSGPASNTPVSTTVTVTDAFERQASATVSWTVKPQLALAGVPNQVGLFNRSVTEVALQASGGAGGYAFSATGLPTGVRLNASTGRITGSPTVVGEFTVNATVKDQTGRRTATMSFTWTVSYPPLVVSQPPPQTSTVDTADELLIAVEGGSGEYTFADKDLPTGLNVDSTGKISGTPSGVAKKSVSITVTDTKAKQSGTVTFDWNVMAKPTLAAPSNPATNSRGASVRIPLTMSCEHMPCTYDISGQPPGIAFDGANKELTGIIATDAAVRDYSVSLTIKDAAGATVKREFTWKVVAAPTVANPGNQATTKGTSVSVQIATSCAHTTCAYGSSGVPAGLAASRSGNIITISGTLSTSAANSYTTTISVRDASNQTVTSSFAWTTNPAPSWRTVPAQTSRVGQRIASLELEDYVSGGTRDFTAFAVVGNVSLPSGLRLNSSTGTISGTPSAQTARRTIQVRVTDRSGATATTSFTWTVNS